MVESSTIEAPALPAIVLKGEGEIKFVKRRAVRIPCAQCGEDAVRRHSYLLPNARRNPASSAYGGDDVSWCSDHDEFTCLACFPEGKHPTVEGYEWCSLFSASDRFAHMFLKWKEEPADAATVAGPDLLAAILEADGCFEAALAEGWLDALANDDMEAIRDLWHRRLAYARAQFPSAIAQASGAQS